MKDVKVRNYVRRRESNISSDENVANVIMDISSNILSENNENSGTALNKPKNKKQFLSDLKDNGIRRVSNKVMRILENENFHTETSILEEKGIAKKGWYR